MIYQASSGVAPQQWDGVLNRDSKQAVGLVAAFHPLLGWRDLIAGQIMTPVANASAYGNNARIGRTYSFDGTDDCAYVTLPETWKLQRFTVSAWMQVNSVPALSTYFALVPRGAAADGRGLFAYIYTDSKPGFAIGSGTAYSYANCATAITLGAPVHITATYDGANARNYINGQLITTTAIAITISYTDKSTSHGPNPASAYIGAYHNSTNSSPATTADIIYDFNGQIGTVGLYNRALSAADIWALYDPHTRWELYQPTRPLIWWIPFDDGSATISMDALAVASSAQDLGVVRGAVSVAVDALAVASSAPDLSVVRGAVAVALDALTVASSAPDLGVVRGAVSVAVDALTVASSAPDLGVTTVGSVALDALGVASAAPDMAVTPGELWLSNTAATGNVLWVAAQDLSASSGPSNTALDALAVAISAPDLSVATGAVSVALDALTVGSSAGDLVVLIGERVVLDALAVASSAPNLVVVHGAISVGLDVLSVASSALDLAVTSGRTIALDALAVASGAPDLVVTPGDVGLINTAATGNVLGVAAQDLSASSPNARAALDALTVGSSAPDLVVAHGAISVALDVLTVGSAAQDLSLLSVASIGMDALAVGSSALDLSASIGAVTLAMDALTIATAAADLGVGRGAISVALDGLTVASGALDLVTAHGAISVGLDVLVTASGAADISVFVGQSTTLDALSMASSVQNLAGVTGGPTAVRLDALVIVMAAQLMAVDRMYMARGTVMGPRSSGEVSGPRSGGGVVGAGSRGTVGRRGG